MRPTLVVFLATVVVAVGVVVVVVSGRGEAAAPRSAPSNSLSASPTTILTAPPEPTPMLTVDTGCRLGHGPRALAEVPPPVTARVDGAWERIENWLAEHAPVSAASLRAPADDESIALTQRAIGVPLPPELVASLRRHDGVADEDVAKAFNFPPFMQPLSSARIVEEATMMCDVLQSVGDDGAVGAWWHGRYVPVAVDHGGDSLFLDGARLGRHYEADDVTFEGGYVDLLERTADALVTGDGEYRPVVVDGVLGWEF